MSETSRIRQVVFLVENKIYKFDVNSHSTLKNLRKMVIAACNISNKVFEFTQNKKEIKAAEDTTIEKLFPNQDPIEINVNLIKQKSYDPDLPVRLNQGISCDSHEFKFPYLYCYDCSKSICSLCVQNDEHRNHEFIDKHDYLQNSEILINTIFRDLSDILTGLPSGEKKVEIERVKIKITTEYIPRLTKQIESIGFRLVEVVEYFLKQVDENKDTLMNNIDQLKKLCADGLEELKYQLKIQDIMIDEDIFLTFDEKIRQIALQKQNIFGDKRKYEEIVNSATLIDEAVESTYTEISKIIDTKLKTTFHEDFKQKVLSNTVLNINKEEIYNILFSDFKKHAKSPHKTQLTAYSVEKSARKGGLTESGYKKQTIPKFDINKNVSNTNFVADEGDQTKLPEERQNIIDQIFASKTKSQPAKDVETETLDITMKTIENLKKTPLTTPHKDMGTQSQFIGVGKEKTNEPGKNLGTSPQEVKTPFKETEKKDVTMTTELTTRSHKGEETEEKKKQDLIPDQFKKYSAERSSPFQTEKDLDSDKRRIIGDSSEKKFPTEEERQRLPSEKKFPTEEERQRLPSEKKFPTEEERQRLPSEKKFPTEEGKTKASF